MATKLAFYLQTGDNMGSPWWDEYFAYLVGESGPKLRLEVDNAIAACDRQWDQPDLKPISGPDYVHP